MKQVCDYNRCTGCKVCEAACPVHAIRIEDTLKSLNAEIDEEKCIECGLCQKICQVRNPSELRRPSKWYQGWAKSDDIRSGSSSGGAAAAFAKRMIESGGFVCTCRFTEGRFLYVICSDVEELGSLKGSMYVKSDPGEIYKRIKKMLDEGHKGVFIGLPCHVSAVLHLLNDKEKDNLLTVDLICHGTPSPRLLSSYLEQYDCSLEELDSIKFRYYDEYRIIVNSVEKYRSVPVGIRDRYTMAFLKGLTFTENCYTCPYAGIERVSDITIGDSWGSELDRSEQRKGISLILCQTEKGVSFVNQCELELLDVDLAKAQSANRQLNSPAVKPKQRDALFSLLEKGMSFNRALTICCPRMCIRSDVKQFLMKMRILRNNSQT